ncbi:endonuclease domain-containing protein [uncultured Sphingomonas sp.]|uniref:endonuclease domain-containing protein n=1 Tax=uncultured Sphingomonas sp. TaxID=158754 RepID=UPI0035CBEB8E
MRLEGSNFGRSNANRLRRAMTPPEIALWLALRQNDAGLRFRKQQAAGDYVLDFFCAPARLVIEVDGEAHERGDRPARDALRDAWLRGRGVDVLRFAARDVLTELEAVVRQIMAIAVERRDAIASGRRPPPPSPSAPPVPG